MFFDLKVIHIPIIAPNITNAYNTTEDMSIGGTYYQKQVELFI